MELPCSTSRSKKATISAGSVKSRGTPAAFNNVSTRHQTGVSWERTKIAKTLLISSRCQIRLQTGSETARVQRAQQACAAGTANSSKSSLKRTSPRSLAPAAPGVNPCKSSAAMLTSAMSTSSASGSVTAAAARGQHRRVTHAWQAPREHLKTWGAPRTCQCRERVASRRPHAGVDAVQLLVNTPRVEGDDVPHVGGLLLVLALERVRLERPRSVFHEGVAVRDVHNHWAAKTQGLASERARVNRNNFCARLQTHLCRHGHRMQSRARAAPAQRCMARLGRQSLPSL